MTTKWNVHREREGCWRGFWIAQPPDGDDSYAFFSHAAALAFAVTDPLIRLEAWLAVQPKPWLGDDHWGTP
jgi:hypothetical protein